MKYLKTFENYENEIDGMERKYTSDAWVQAQRDAEGLDDDDDDDSDLEVVSSNDENDSELNGTCGICGGDASICDGC